MAPKIPLQIPEVFRKLALLKAVLDTETQTRHLDYEAIEGTDAAFLLKDNSEKEILMLLVAAVNDLADRVKALESRFSRV